MKQILTFLLFLLSLNIFGQTKVIELTNCLKEHFVAPKEYILNLFKTNDIVIIGERDHRDTTQYDLLLDIFKDERFINEVGNIYTEVGCTNKTEFANQVLKTTYKNDDDFEKQLIILYRELDFNPLWEKYNMYKYLKGIYSINKDLGQDEKITVGLTDLAFDWDNMNRKRYRTFEEYMNATSYTRDSLMAVNFIHLYEKQKPKDGKRKALLIQSFPHAINLDLNPYGARHRTTGSYIVERYKEKVEIVAFNSVYFGKNNDRLIDKGQWDAAFEAIGCNPIAFNIQNTPVGTSEFEEQFGINFKGRLGVEIKFQEIIDGFIFYIPFYNFKLTVGIPNVVDKDFSKELMRRTIICQDSFFNRLVLSIFQPFYEKRNANYYNDVRTFQAYDNNSLKEQMNKFKTGF